MQTREELLRRVLAVVSAGAAPALGAVACGGSVDDTGQTRGGGEGGAAGSAVTTTGGTTAAPAGGGGGGLTTGGQGGWLVTTGGTPSRGGATAGRTGFVPIQLPIPEECRRSGPEGEYLEQPPASCGSVPPDAYQLMLTCLGPPPDGMSCDEAFDHSCVAGAYRCGLSTMAGYVCGPLPDQDGCCYVLAGGCPIGRPYLVSGVARRAGVEPGTGWATAAAPDVSGLDAVTRGALAEAWAEEGATEHASVAAFARFTLQCLSVGAPADLVQAAQQAGLDEVGHARAAFALASAYAGRELRPGRLDVSGSLEGELDPICIARSVASESCIAETVSAVLVAAARDAATDPAVHATLVRTAIEENEHALLGWRYLRWALDGGSPELRAAVAEVFARAGDHVGLGAVTAGSGCASAMRQHGYLPPEERRALAIRTLREVIAPAARALLGATASPAVTRRASA